MIIKYKLQLYVFAPNTCHTVRRLQFLFNALYVYRNNWATHAFNITCSSQTSACSKKLFWLFSDRYRALARIYIYIPISVFVARRTHHYSVVIGHNIRAAPHRGGCSISGWRGVKYPECFIYCLFGLPEIKRVVRIIV